MANPSDGQSIEEVSRISTVRGKSGTPLRQSRDTVPRSQSENEFLI